MVPPPGKLSAPGDLSGGDFQGVLFYQSCQQSVSDRSHQVTSSQCEGGDMFFKHFDVFFG